MPASGNYAMARRSFLAGAVASAGAIALPGAAFAQATSDSVHRLLVLASQNAFAKLTAPDGFWTSRVARFGLPVLFRKTPSNASGPLGKDTFRAELQHRLNVLAEAGARGAAPIVAEAARKLAVSNPAAILQGKPSAAASLLRLEMSSGLVNAMIPPLEKALTAAQDPIVAQAAAALTGVALRDVAHAVAIAADNGIWYEIGMEEADIRANPQLSNDPALIAALRPAAPAIPAPAAPSPKS